MRRGKQGNTQRYCFELRQGEQKIAKDAKATVPRCSFHVFKIVVNPEWPFAHSCAVTLKRSCTKECICNAEVCGQQFEGYQDLPVHNPTACRISPLQQQLQI